MYFIATCLLVLAKGKVYTVNVPAASEVPLLVSGFDDQEVIFISTHVGARHFPALTADGKVYTWGVVDNRISPIPVLVEELSGKFISRIAVGPDKSGAITSSGDLYLWGKGKTDRLGHSSYDHIPFHFTLEYDVVDVAFGRDSFTIAITKEGVILTWGGDDVDDRLVVDDAIRLYGGVDYFAVLTKQGHVYVWRASQAHGIIVRFPPTIPRIVDVSVGLNQCLVSTAIGQVYGWSHNEREHSSADPVVEYAGKKFDRLMVALLETGSVSVTVLDLFLEYEVSEC